MTTKPLGGYPEHVRTYGLANGTNIPTEVELEAYVKDKGYPTAFALLERSLQILRERADNHGDPGVQAVSRMDAIEVERIMKIMQARFGAKGAA